MKRWLRSISIAMVAVLTFTGCATILSGSVPKDQRTEDVRWGYVILDVLFTGLIGLVIDFGTGAIYERKPGTKSELYHQLKMSAKSGAPAYVVKPEGVYQAVVLGDAVTLTRVPDSILPPVVLASLRVHGYQPVLALAR